MKGRWESNINVWFPFTYSQKWSFPKKNYNVLSLNSYTHISVRFIYFRGSVCLFCCRKICGPILGICKSLTDTWMWKLGLMLRNSQKRNRYLNGIFVAVYLCCQIVLLVLVHTLNTITLKYECSMCRLLIRFVSFLNKSRPAYTLFLYKSSFSTFAFLSLFHPLSFTLLLWCLRTHW